jgi:hypothetical protein
VNMVVNTIPVVGFGVGVPWGFFFLISSLACLQPR